MRYDDNGRPGNGMYTKEQLVEIIAAAEGTEASSRVRTDLPARIGPQECYDLAFVKAVADERGIAPQTIEKKVRELYPTVDEQLKEMDIRGIVPTDAIILKNHQRKFRGICDSFYSAIESKLMEMYPGNKIAGKWEALACYYGIFTWNLTISRESVKIGNPEGRWIFRSNGPQIVTKTDLVHILFHNWDTDSTDREMGDWNKSRSYTLPPEIDISVVYKDYKSMLLIDDIIERNAKAYKTYIGKVTKKQDFQDAAPEF
jgi:hypothetical protein